jgi:dipeptidyl aminopeptidase/acylaminoacyl peptidase
MMKTRLPLFLIIVLLSVLKLNAQNTNTIQLTDLTKIISTSAHEITPDGKQVLYIKNFIESSDSGRGSYKAQVWKSELTPPYTSYAITSTEYNVSNFSLSPDGKKIAFVRPKDGKNQLFLLSLEGGESQLVTNETYGVGSPIWSPDGKNILFSSTLPIWAIAGTPEWGHQRPGRVFGDEPHYKAIEAGLVKEEIKPNPDGDLSELRAWLSKNSAKKDPKVIDRLNFLGESDLNPELSFSHLRIVNLETKEVTILTEGFQNYFGATWSPDGSFILASSLKNTEHPDLTNHTEVWKINISSREAKVFFALENHRVGNPEFSPDGRWIAISYQNMEEPSYNMNHIGILKADGSGFKQLTEPLDRSVSNVKWSADSQFVFFTGASQGGYPIWKTNISSGKIEPIVTGQVGVTSFAIRNQKLVYALTLVENPSEIYLADINNKNPIKISRFNDGWLSEKSISKPISKKFTSNEGFEVEYWIMEPINRQPGFKYPTVLQMHGGPSAMWGPGEGSMWHEFQVMAAKGYGVVYANPRGSGGYGKAFQKGNYRNWGDGPASDVLGALDEAQKEVDWIDKDQLFLTGGSYAGYLTTWIVGHDHRFKAAFSQRGVYELTFFMGEGNAWRLVPNHFGYPWEEGVKEILDYNSPQTYVQNIQTPLLIKHSDVDFRTGVRQSELLYKSLKILGKPVEYVRYPDEGHELSRSGAVHRRIDRIGRIIEFFERYVTHP